MTRDDEPVRRKKAPSMDLTNSELLCIRYLDHSYLEAEPHERWPDLDLLVERKLVDKSSTYGNWRYYLTNLGRLAIKEGMAKRKSGKPAAVPGERPTLKDAAHSLAVKLRDHPQVVSVGTRATSIGIMADLTKFSVDPVTEIIDWEGWPVTVVDHGPMATMGVVD